MKSFDFLRGSRRPAITIIIGILSIFAVGSANAVLLGLVPDVVPDAKARNSIDYYFTNTTDNTGGFTMEVRGLVTSLVDLTGVHNVSGDCSSLGCYTLDATFTSGGIFSGGSISLTGIAPTSSPLLNSGVLVTAPLTDFGWGGNNQSGLFEFSYDLLSNQASGDFKDVWAADNGGTIIDTRELAQGAGMLGTCNGADQSGCYVGDWDTSGLMTQEFSTAQSPGIFLSGGTTSDTFVPVPAAVWLFGSALGFVAFMRRRVGSAS